MSDPCPAVFQQPFARPDRPVFPLPEQNKDTIGAIALRMVLRLHEPRRSRHPDRHARTLNLELLIRHSTGSPGHALLVPSPPPFSLLHSRRLGPCRLPWSPSDVPGNAVEHPSERLKLLQIRVRQWKGRNQATICRNPQAAMRRTGRRRMPRKRLFGVPLLLSLSAALPCRPTPPRQSE